MRRSISMIAIATIMMISLSACVTNGQGGVNKQMVGTVLGGGLGGFLGSKIGGGSGNIAAIIIGTLVGAAAGNQAGASLDRADQLTQQANANATLNNVPSGNTTVWRSPDAQKQVSGTFTPIKTYQERSGRYCREYQNTITIGGKTERGYGTACRTPSGDWEIITSGTQPPQTSTYNQWQN